jgi:magnesium-transporting ATPase (P-type)
MTTKPKRPPSVWISQVILVLYSIFGTFTFAVGLVAISTQTMDPYGEATLYVVGTTVVVTGVLVAAFVAAFTGLSKRRPWGRWLTVAIFVVMMMMSLLQALSPIFGDASAAFPSSQSFASFAIVILLGLLTYRLAHGEAANAFFNSPKEQDEIIAPPPPPTFAE